MIIVYNFQLVEIYLALFGSEVINNGLERVGEGGGGGVGGGRL